MIGTWNVTSLEEKETELVCKVDRHLLDIDGFNSTNSIFLERALFQSGVSHSEEQGAELGVFISPHLAA